MSDVMGNYYLELLKKQIFELKSTIAKVDKNKDGFSMSAYNAILSGMIIKINIIIEQTLADFHGDKFNEVVSSVYNLRQLLVHYHDYNNIEDIEQSCLDIIRKFNRAYSSENEFFKKILTYKNDDEKNIVVQNSKDIYYDESSCSYVFKYGDKGIIVSREKVTTIKSLKKGKVMAYIVEMDEPITHFKIDENKEMVFEKIESVAMMRLLFKTITNVIKEDYREHKDCIRACLDNLYCTKKSLAALNVYIKQKSSVDGNTLSIQISKVLNHYFNERIIYSEFLQSRDFITWTGLENSNCPYYDVLGIRDNCEKSLIENINKKDFFFIYKTISSFNLLNSEIMKNEHLPPKQKEMMIEAFLIKWVDQTIKNFSEEFINANKEFREIHNSLINYRNFYAHDIQQFRNNGDTIEDFLYTARGYVAILNSLQINKIGRNEKKKEVKFAAIESDVSDFVNCRYGQYLQINPTTFVGNKLFYSTCCGNTDKIVGLVPIDKDYPLKWSYYTLKDNLLISSSLKRRKRGKNNTPNCANHTKVKFDVNCDDLLYIFAACSGVIEEIPVKNIYKPHHQKLLLFKASEDNNYKAHASALVDVLTNYYSQRYLPIELIKETKLEIVYDENKKANFIITDKEENEIARIIDSKHIKNYELEVDSDEVVNLRKTIKEYRG